MTEAVATAPEPETVTLPCGCVVDKAEEGCISIVANPAMGIGIQQCRKCKTNLGLVFVSAPQSQNRIIVPGGNGGH